MAIAPEILEAMKDAGASIDVILAAIRADQALADKVAVERRAKDRERQRRHRKSRAVTPVTRDNCDTPPNDNILTPPSIPPKPSGLAPKPKTGKRPLPENWQPAPIKPDGVAGMVIAAWPAGRLERELSKFKDHALAGNVKHDNWDAAFRNWVKKAGEFDERYSRNPANTNLPRIGKTTAAIASLGGFGDDTPM